MNCRFCGTALPDDAVFCGECGRPAASASGRRRATMPKLALGGRSDRSAVLVEEPPTRFAPATPVLDAAEPLDLVALDPVAPAPAADLPEVATVSCPQCGRVVLATDVFCGDCGFVLGSAVLPSPSPSPEPEPVEAFTPPAVPDARDTAALAPADLDFSGIVVRTAPRDQALSGVELVGEPSLDVEPEPEPADVDEAEITEIAPEPVRAEVSPFAPDPARLLAAAAVASADVGPEAEADEPAASETRAEEERPARPLRSVPDPFPWGKGPAGTPVDLEKTRAVATGPAEERFVLQFSTGESVTVTGAGLVGRNPSSQPGEYVDQLVTIFDAGKSVSKTHLEFGQDSGRFWVSDRYSTNGSTVRQPDLEPKRCEPGRRYFVARGTRVDIGEQFFVVS